MLRLRFNDRIPWLGNIGRRTMFHRSHSNLGIRMKQLNDSKQFRETLILFDESQPKNLNDLPSTVLTQVFKACTKIEDYQRALDIYTRLSFQTANDPFIIASVIHLYSENSFLGNARRHSVLFSAEWRRDQRWTNLQWHEEQDQGNLWSDDQRSTANALQIEPMIVFGKTGLIKLKMFQKAIDLFEKISDPDEVLVLLLFNACAQVSTTGSLSLATDVYSRIPSSFHRNPRLSAAAFDMFLKHDSLLEAEQLFAKMKNNVISYGNLMNAYNRRNEPQKSLLLFERMKIDRIDVNLVICLLLINACSQVGIESISRSIVSQMPAQFLSNHRVRNALIDMWVSSIEFNC